MRSVTSRSRIASAGRASQRQFALRYLRYESQLVEWPTRYTLILLRLREPLGSEHSPRPLALFEGKRIGSGLFRVLRVFRGKPDLRRRGNGECRGFVVAMTVGRFALHNWNTPG